MAFNQVFDEFPTLETSRFCLRQLSLNDTPAVFKIFSDPAVTQYYDVPTMKKPETAGRLIRWWSNRFKYHRAIRWGITFKGSDEVVGTFGFSELDKENLTAEIGYDLQQPYWHQGIMTEVAREVIHFGFHSAMQLNRIETWVILENRGSIRVLEKIGFQSEGVLRQRRFWENHFYDVEMFSLLRREYLVEASPKHDGK